MAARTSPRAARESAGKPGARKAEMLLGYYREMLLIRRFEEKAGQLYGMGLIGGFCHLYIGQEAVVVGMQMAIREGDQVIRALRIQGLLVKPDNLFSTEAVPLLADFSCEPPLIGFRDLTRKGIPPRYVAHAYLHLARIHSLETLLPKGDDPLDVRHLRFDEFGILCLDELSTPFG